MAGEGRKVEERGRGAFLRYTSVKMHIREYTWPRLLLLEPGLCAGVWREIRLTLLAAEVV